MSYPSDVTDAEWEEIKDFFKPSRPGRPRQYTTREIYNGIRYVGRSGCQWRMLPSDFPPWKSVYGFFREHRDRGTWEEINAHLRCKVREQAGKKPDPTVAIIDSQSVKTVQKGGKEGTIAANR